MTPTHPVSGACPDSGPEALAAWLRLTLTPGVGSDSARRLLAAFGLPPHVFDQTSAALREVVGPAQASALLKVPDTLAAQVQDTTDYLRRMDLDGDGRVAPDEYQRWMLYAFDRMDRNGNGVLEPEG